MVHCNVFFGCAEYLLPYAPMFVVLLQVLRLLIKLYESVSDPDWVNICQCLMFLDDSQEVAKILHNLIDGTEVRHYCCFFQKVQCLRSPLQLTNCKQSFSTVVGVAG